MKKRYFSIVSLAFLGALAVSSCASSSNSNSRNNPQNSRTNTQISIDSNSSQTPTTSVDNTVLTAIYLNYENLNLYVGRSYPLTVTFEPENYINKTISWSSSNDAVATVSDAGLVTAVSEGTAVITATAEGGLSANCNVTTAIKTSSDTYVPDLTDRTIYFITEDTLSSGTYDSSKDEYSFSISGSYKQIYVKATGKTIVIELNGVTIENGFNSPIYVADSEDIEISAKKGTTNTIKDTRPLLVEEEDDQGKGAIYVANGDLKLKGTGALTINSTYYNGIHCKDDVKIQKLTLGVTAPNHGIRGNDGVTVTSGTINVSCGGDGLHSDNSDISSKGNQKGDVTINGGSLTINSWSDAIQAAYNVVIDQTDTAVATSIIAKTNKYSSYEGEVVETSASNLYLRMNSSTYSKGSYTYAALINGNWYPATYKGTESSGGGFPGGGGGPGGPGGSTYYIYQLEKPASAESFTLYRFQGSNVTSFSTESYNAKSDGKAFNSAYDMVTITVSNSKISFGTWSNYSNGNGNSADISAKGIKAENEIYINAGTIDIKSYDDAIHANNDGILENGGTPLGNINIAGGNLTLNASDDAVHADYKLNITGGTINVESAYEGLEANVVNVSGGESYVYATDDGMNATKGNETPAINVSGGLLDVTVPTNGDTDGIDSNGTFNQTGGVVIVKGPGTAGSTGSPAAAMDTDGAITLSGGTLAVFGGIERNPSTSLTRTLCSSKTVAAGAHTISFSGGSSISTTLKNSTNGCLVYSELGTATLS